MPTIFISYRRDDDWHAVHNLYQELRRKFGKPSVFFDIDTIPLGIDFQKHIEDVFSTCDIVLVVIGDQWFNKNDQGQRRIDDPKDYVHLEVRSALERDIPVVPVLVGKAPIPDASELPEPLKPLVRRNAIEVPPGPNFQNQIRRLIQDIKAITPPKKTSTWLLVLAGLAAAAILTFLALSNFSGSSELIHPQHKLEHLVERRRPQQINL